MFKNFDELSKFLGTLRQTEGALSTTIKIDHGQVLEIVVKDLFEKYRHNINCKNEEWAQAFEKILLYYLEPEELAEMQAQNSL